MDLELQGKVALVTGASSGIGLATARAFAREGALVVMVSLTAAKLEQAAAQLRAETGARIETWACDLTREDDCAELVAHVAATLGRIDVLVNNASAPLPIGDFLNLGPAQWQSAWTGKLQVSVTMCRLVFPLMRRQGGGRIVLVIGAHAARNPAPSYLPIGAISAGMVNLVKGLADLGAPDNILVTGVSPSGVQTERLRAWLARRAASEGKSIDEVAVEQHAEYGLKRAGRPEEVGDVICFLASARASYVSGVVLTVDGNLTRGVSL